MNARRLLILLPLLLAACGGDAETAFQTLPLSGSPAEIQALEGEWYDGDGTLMAVITSGREPSVSAGLPKELVADSARIEGKELVFHLPRRAACRCNGDFRADLKVLGFVRAPSALWVAGRTTAKALRLCPRTYARIENKTLDWLGRVL